MFYLRLDVSDITNKLLLFQQNTICPIIKSKILCHTNKILQLYN